MRDAEPRPKRVSIARDKTTKVSKPNVQPNSSFIWFNPNGTVLNKGTGQWGLHFALNLAAEHFWWVTAHLYEEQISIGVTAVTHCLL